MNEVQVVFFTKRVQVPNHVLEAGHRKREESIEGVRELVRKRMQLKVS